LTTLETRYPVPPAPRPLRVAIVNDYEVVVAGLATILREFPDRVEIVELDNQLPVTCEVDIVLFDTFAHVDGRGPGVSDFARPGGPRLVVFTWTAHPQSVASALEQGAAGYLSKTLSPLELVTALEDIRAGAIVTSACFEPGLGHAPGTWPGHEAGLSARESEVLALVARGLPNQEVADALHMSINTVKSHIRTAYRKIGAGSRSQAVLWAVEHGFVSEPHRIFPTSR
jgi:two-component system, NarL family, response regulator LiaR